jgi:predicted RNA binding protein YcfA (HicA-like mRNA interferase family)
MTSASLIKELLGNGWKLIGVRGSHHYYEHPTLKGKVTIPHPKKDLPIGTLKAIRKHAQLD